MNTKSVLFIIAVICLAHVSSVKFSLKKAASKDGDEKTHIADAVGRFVSDSLFEMSSNRDGSVDEREAARLFDSVERSLASAFPDVPAEELRISRDFASFNTNQSGRIDRAEFRVLGMGLAERVAHLSRRSESDVTDRTAHLVANVCFDLSGRNNNNRRNSNEIRRAVDALSRSAGVNERNVNSLNNNRSGSVDREELTRYVRELIEGVEKRAHSQYN